MIRFIYSAATYAAKPKEQRILQGLQKPANYVFTEVEQVADVARIIGEGRTWRAGLYDYGIDSFKKANVKAVQVIALDFDSCPHEPQTIVEYATSIGISPSAWYYSYSQGIKEGFNFRVLWILAEAIKPIQYETIYKAMLEQFSQFNPDQSTKDASRMWFGGNRGVNVLTNTPIPLSVIGWLGVAEKVKQGQAIQKARKAVKACESEYFTAEAEGIEPIFITQAFKWWESLRFKCWLWDRWENGIYLNYNQRLTLFTNLKYIKYADNNQSVIKQVLDIFYKYQAVYAGHTCNEEQIRSMFLNTTLHAIGIVKVSGEENPITVKEYLSRTPHVVINTENKISLEELDKRLTEDMPRLLSEDGIVYIKSQTASGKTYHVIQWILQQDLSKKKIIYSVPRYTNMDDFTERFKAAYYEANKDKPLYDDIDIVKQIPKGKYTSADLLLMEMGFPAATRQDERYRAIQEMINKDSKGLFVCSHQCIAHLRECPADCIIIDENIEDALLDVVILDKAGLGSLIGFVENEEKRQDVLNLIGEIETKQRGELVNIDPLKRALINFDWEGYFVSKTKMAGIGKILDPTKEPPKITKIKGSSAIRFTTKSTLIESAIQSGTPIKLLSATPKNEKLNALYKVNIPLIEFPLARNEGEIIQYMGITGAKGNDCSKVPDLIEFVKKKVPEEEQKEAYVLSFKDAIPQWKAAGFKIPEYNGTPLHIANNAGLDMLKGKIVIVAGKYDENDDNYLDTYFDDNPDKTTPPSKTNKTVMIANRICSIFTWDDEKLRNQQIQNIKMYLEQAAGRARALREAKAKVYVFANLPIDDTDKWEDD